MPTTAQQLALHQWLAAADPDPDHAHRWWDATQVALLPLGVTWDAVKCSGARGWATLGCGVSGPVVHDPDDDGGSLYFLVPTGTSTSWRAFAGVELLGPACYLTIPAVEKSGPPGVYWAQPPRAVGALVSPERLRAVLARTSGAEAAR